MITSLLDLLCLTSAGKKPAGPQALPASKMFHYKYVGLPQNFHLFFSSIFISLGSVESLGVSLLNKGVF
jgi:hypothetical protein